MFFQISQQPGAEPSELEAVTGIVQILHGLLLRHVFKIHLIERSDNGSPVAAPFAVKIDGMITLVVEDCQYMVDMLLLRRNRRSVHYA